MLVYRRIKETTLIVLSRYLGLASQRVALYMGQAWVFVGDGVGEAWKICGGVYEHHSLGGGFKYFYVHPYLGKIPMLTHIFQMG